LSERWEVSLTSIDTGRIMNSKSSILAFRSTAQTTGVVLTDKGPRPTEAERAYVRARARQAARATFEAERHESVTTPEGEVPCE
jgi:hypothetical protein